MSMGSSSSSMVDLVADVPSVGAGLHLLSSASSKMFCTYESPSMMSKWLPLLVIFLPRKEVVLPGSAMPVFLKIGCFWISALRCGSLPMARQQIEGRRHTPWCRQCLLGAYTRWPLRWSNIAKLLQGVHQVVLRCLWWWSKTIHGLHMAFLIKSSEGVSSGIDRTPSMVVARCRVLLQGPHVEKLHWCLRPSRANPSQVQSPGWVSKWPKVVLIYCWCIDVMFIGDSFIKFESGDATPDFFSFVTMNPFWSNDVLSFFRRCFFPCDLLENALITIDAISFIMPFIIFSGSNPWKSLMMGNRCSIIAIFTRRCGDGLSVHEMNGHCVDSSLCSRRFCWLLRSGSCLLSCCLLLLFLLTAFGDAVIIWSTGGRRCCSAS